MCDVLARTASVTTLRRERYLFDSDDARVLKARAQLSVPKNRTKEVDWAKCEARHQRARMDEQLGRLRPFTGWEEGGGCRLPDFCWNDWALPQVHLR